MLQPAGESSTLVSILRTDPLTRISKRTSTHRLHMHLGAPTAFSPIVLVAVLSIATLKAQEIEFQKSISPNQMLLVRRQEIQNEIPNRTGAEKEWVHSHKGWFGYPDHTYLLTYVVVQPKGSSDAVWWTRKYGIGHMIMNGGGYRTFDANVESNALVVVFLGNETIRGNVVLRDNTLGRPLLTSSESVITNQDALWVVEHSELKGAFSNSTLSVTLSGNQGIQRSFVLDEKDGKYRWLERTRTDKNKKE
jgi:hypothetical protein